MNRWILTIVGREVGHLRWNKTFWLSNNQCSVARRSRVVVSFQSFSKSLHYSIEQHITISQGWPGESRKFQRYLGYRAMISPVLDNVPVLPGKSWVICSAKSLLIWMWVLRKWSRGSLEVVQLFERRWFPRISSRPLNYPRKSRSKLFVNNDSGQKYLYGPNFVGLVKPWRPCSANHSFMNIFTIIALPWTWSWIEPRKHW
jgi:hypothetical protein